VRGRRSPLVGSLVVADVVLAEGVEKGPELLAELTRWCSARLPEYGVPRRITVLDEIDSTETGKSAL
jgi:acyl-coenzyme A synthetase/AMP-(fatty) acid ligase